MIDDPPFVLPVRLLYECWALPKKPREPLVGSDADHREAVFLMMSELREGGREFAELGASATR